MVNYYGGIKAINNLDSILTDYDYSTNYRTQGYGYQGSDYHSNRPGNTLSLILFESQLLKNPLLIVKSVLAQKDSLRYLGSKTSDEKAYSLIAMTLSSGRVITTYVDQSNYQMAKVEFLSKGALNEYSY